MLVKQLNILFFSFFFTLLISFSLQASSLQSKINQSYQPNINRPYGLFFVEADKLEGEKEISFNEISLSYNRKLQLSFTGKKILGKERISLNQTSKKDYFFYIPFYFHPDVEIWKSDNSGNFLLKIKNNEIWRFETDKKNVFLENYKFLDPLDLEIKNGKRIILFSNFDQKEQFLNWKLYL